MTPEFSLRSSLPGRLRLGVVVLLVGACLLIAYDRLPLRPVHAKANAGAEAVTLHGAAAIEQLKKNGSYSSLAAAMNAARYSVQPGANHNWQAPNPAQQFNATFGGDGVRIVAAQSTESQWKFGLKLVGYGYGEQLVPTGEGEVTASGERVEIRKSAIRNPQSAITEWYVNKPEGLEQGFTLTAPPQSPISDLEPAGSLRLALRVTGDLRAESVGNRQAMILKTRRGQTVLSYDHLAVWDAKGKALPASLNVQGNELIVEINDAGAVYPVTIDPLIAQQAKLTAADGATNDYFGDAVAVSGDTALIGALGDDAARGSAYVFVRSGATWTQQAKLVAADGAAGDSFGGAVALEGNTAVIGASGADLEGNTSHGAAYVFTRSGASWSQQAKLAVSDGAQVKVFGYAVAVSGDTALIGAPYYGLGGEASRGAVYVYTRSGASWTLQQKLLAADGASGDDLGYVVALDGNTALIGAPYDDNGAVNNQGSAYVFTRSGAAWTQQQKLLANDGAASDAFGYAVALSGETALIGAPNDDVGANTEQGSAYVFTRVGAAWNQQQKLVVADGVTNDGFGTAVALAGDLAVIGAPDFDGFYLDNLGGSAYVFARNGATFTQQNKLNANGGSTSFDSFGKSVAISGGTVLVGAYGVDAGAVQEQGATYVFAVYNDLAQQQSFAASDSADLDLFGASLAVSGDTAVVGAPGDDINANQNQGSAYVFVRNGATWSQQQKLTASNGAANDFFGFDVGISGNTVVVGASYHKVGANTNQGTAYVFVRNGATWSQEAILVAGDGAAGDFFGDSVAVSEDTAVIGARTDTVNANANQGSAYVFVRNAGSWSQQQKLTANDGAAQNFFGVAVAVNGDVAIIGADGAVINGKNNQGAAYVFTRSGAAWGQSQKLAASDGQAQDGFGYAIALNSVTAVISAHKADSSKGSVYVFARNGAAWNQQQKLTAADGTAGDDFGTSVALDGNRIAVGAAYADVSGMNDRGAAYLFTSSGATWSQLQKLTASDGTGNNYLGSGVALPSNAVLASATKAQVGGATTGKVYVFNYQSCPTISLTPGSLPGGTVSNSYNQQLAASGGAGPYQYALAGGTLPPGLSLSQSGLLAGTLTQAGTYNFTLMATTGNLCSGSQSYTVTIAPLCQPITINPASLNGGTVGVAYSQPFSALGGTAPYGFNLAQGSSLPPGIGIINGTLSGIPSQTGTFNFTIQVIDSNGCTDTRAYSMTVVPNCPAITVLPVGLQNGHPNTAYNQTLTGSGGQAPYTAGVTAGALPPGLSLGFGNQITGTPTQLGTFNFTITLTDANGCTGQRGYTLAISPTCNALSATPSTLPAGTQGVAYNQTLTGSGGVAPYTFSIEQATLPVPGLTLAANGTISGTPTTTGTFPFDVDVTDVNGCVGTSHHTITVNPLCGTITLGPATLAAATIGQAYGETVTAQGGTPGYSYGVTAGALPNGLTLGAAGEITGTPTDTGTFNFTITATDANSCTGQNGYAITVGCPAINIVPPPPNGSVGNAYNHTFNATGNAGPYTYTLTAGTLPTGLTLSAAGAITGTPTTTGNFNFTVRAVNASGCSGEASFAVTIITCPAITIVQNTLVTGTVGTAYGFQLNVNGAVSPYAYSLTAGALPSGLTLTPAGFFTGTPTQAGSFPITVRVTDANGCTGERNFVMVVNPAGCPTITVDPTSLASATSGVAYNQQLTADGGAGPYSFAVTTGSLPAGLTLSTTGVISGTTAAVGTVNFTITATDANLCTGAREYQLFISVTCPLITIVPATLPDANAGGVYNVGLSAQGGVAPYTYAVIAGQVPPNMSVSPTGNFGGQPQQTGTFNFTVEATDANGCNGTQAYQFNVVCQTITISPSSLPNGAQGQSYNQQLSAPGLPPLTFSLMSGTLPTGLTLAQSGLISGMPTQSGSFPLTVKVTDGNGCTGTRAYTLVISGGCPTITVNPSNATLPAGQAGVQYNQTFTQTGGSGTATFTISAGALPNGMSLSTGGVLSGAPTAFGNFNFTVKATDANGCMGTRAYALTINPPCGTITVNPTTLPNGTVGTAYNQTATATGGTAPYTYTVSGGTLPGGLNLAAGGALTGTPNAAGIFNFTIKATDANGCMGTRAHTVTISGGVVNNGLQFYPLPFPLRLLDTRAGFSGCDSPGAPITGGTSRTQLARRTCNGVTIPANAMAVTGNVTTVQSGGGYLTLYPSDVPQPLVANTNFAPNEILNNVFTVGLGNADGSFKIFATSNTHVVVDITGYYAPPAANGLYFHPLPKPVRLLDTRAGFTGCFAPGVPFAAGSDNTQIATGACGGVTIPATALAVVGNATTVGPQTGGYLTFYPANVQRPLAANSNFIAGQIINAPFTVGLSPSGAFNIYTTSATDLVVDVAGYYSADASDANGAGLLFNPLPAPVRLLETRAGFTGCYTTNAPLLTGSTRNQQARGVCSAQTIAANALAIVGNATVINDQAGYLTFWPNGAAQPLVATSNFNVGQILNRHFTVGLGANGMFNIFASAQTDLIVDVSGFFAP